jgi:hypothetical protein
MRIDNVQSSKPKMLAVIQGLQYDKMSITEFIGQILQDPSYSSHPLVTDLHSNGVKICDLLCKTTPLPSSMCNKPPVVTLWALVTSMEYFQKELHDLMHTVTDWHFSATHATAQKIEDFKIEIWRNQSRDMHCRFGAGGQNKSGIQKVRVFPMPVPAIEMTFFSPLNGLHHLYLPETWMDCIVRFRISESGVERVATK